jgi:peptidoglycan/LPS O-acetylase OafA/YrhL
MSKDTKRYLWVELIKAFGLIWILVNHVAERLFGAPFIANPNSDWPALSERILQLRPLEGFGIWNIPFNTLRYFGWAGDQGVQLFLIASGFGLTWGLLKRQAGKPLDVRDFYWRRAERIFPLWWGVHILFIGFWFLTGWGLSLRDSETFLSFIGIRITPDTLYYFSPAWWYVGLIIQLYLVYPVLWEGLRKWGGAKLLFWSSVIAFSFRGVGLYVFNEYLDAWARGAIFVTRLPEFVFGICLASWMFSQPEIFAKRLTTPFAWAFSILFYIFGTFLSLTLPGMIFAPFCLGASAFIFLYLLLNKLMPILPRWSLSFGNWFGEHTYSIFLVHNPIISALVPIGTAMPLRVAGWVLASFILTLVSALALEWAVSRLLELSGQRVKKIGILKSFVQLGLLGVIVLVAFVGAELLVRRYDPQEVMGWGERPSLMPDSNFGWRLIPSQTTHLRWESYDYFVSANSLGFPGPEYSTTKNPDTFRILVTGDAFSSAEGVDTDQAWPRLLEAGLSTKLNGKKVEVLNFAITGYGPNQYEAVIQHFAPFTNQI